MREAAKVFSKASHSQPPDSRSRSVMDFYCDGVSKINGSRIKAACPLFSSLTLEENPTVMILRLLIRVTPPPL
jgi:hypothetical protein